MTIVATLGSSGGGGGGGAGGTLIQAQTVSSVASVSFTTGFTYKNYKLIWYNYLQATNAENMLLLLSQDGGATYATTNYLSGIKVSGYNNGGFAAATSTAASIISWTLDNTQTPTAGEIELWQLGIASSTVFPFVNGLVSQTNSNIPITGIINTWYSGATAPINAIQIAPASGNITSGTFILYGIPG